MTAKNSNILTKNDLMRVFWRSFTMEWAWNYERQMNMGFCYSLIPALNKIYKTDEERSDAYKRHLEFFNITPWISTFPMGIAIALEEQNAAEKDFDTSTINNIKIALMGPLSGIGDSFFWGTLRVIATGIGTSLALKGNILGPILFLLIFNIPALLARYFGLKWGYELGSSFIDTILHSGLMDRLTYGASVIGLAVVGAMTASMVNLNIPLTLGSGEEAQTVTDLFNGIVPSVLPLLFTFIILYLVKKEVKAHWILLLMVFLGIFGAYTGILG
ncbi:PTS system mannose/fructose/sorbose family transporter subunit IID [Allofustis seminis]|uniref:PTS system mannose/fructose/sorbose family transporter subunit IID n=1 Tax=Allofustis seminis TaxID=166939 RepID=UPI0003807025|nr:PTS system mannose/fructose/sorbose family transporter subunit IID [Allofustis seminis]